MERDLKVSILVNGQVHYDYVVNWDHNDIEHTTVVPPIIEGEYKLEVKVGRCICRLLECPVHGEINQGREKG